jgi:hypothetical protein
MCAITPNNVCNHPALDARPPALRPRARHQGVVIIRECVLFIGTRFSNLYTAVDTPAEAV